VTRVVILHTATTHTHTQGPPPCVQKHDSPSHILRDLIFQCANDTGAMPAGRNKNASNVNAGIGTHTYLDCEYAVMKTVSLVDLHRKSSVSSHTASPVGSRTRVCVYESPHCNTRNTGLATDAHEHPKLLPDQGNGNATWRAGRRHGARTREQGVVQEVAGA
jgi:hypothetical protein